MPGIVNCPSCRRPLQVPEEFLGTLVKCPSCGATFTATGPGPAQQPPAFTIAQEAPRDPEEQAAPYPGGVAAAEVRGVIASPAVCLIVTGCLGLLCNTCFLNAVLTGEMKRGFQQQPQPDPRAREVQEKMAEAAEGPGAVAFLAIFLAVNVLIILGGVAMLRRRLYALAVTASILAIVDQCCCVIGLPFGIWSLMVLNRPDVKAAFE